MPLITTRVTTAVDATTKNAPLSNAEIDQNFINLNNAITQSGDVTGFVNRTSSYIMFDDASRTLTLAPTGVNFTMYYRGKAILIDSSKTITISNSSGSHWIHWDFTQNRLVDLGSSPNIRDNLLVAYIYWDSSSTSSVIFADERHSVSRDMQWHHYQHNTNGAIWRSGGDISYTINNTNSVTLSLSSPVVLMDEDLEHNITHVVSPLNQYEQNLSSPSGYFPIIYLNGTTYKQTTATTLPWYPSSTRAYYNPIDSGAGTGSLVIAPTNDTFLVYWMVATNDTKFPIKMVMGRNMWASYSEAETENFDSYGLPMPEIAPMYKFILKTSNTYTQNTARVNIVGVRELLGKQNARSNSFDTLSHDSLSDRNLPDQHAISSITGLQTQLDTVAGASVAMAIALG